MCVLIPFIILAFVFDSTCSGVEYPFTSVDVFSRDSTAGGSAYDPSSGAYIVSAAGYGIGGREDDFRFLYLDISGDFSVSVRVDDPEGMWPHPWSKAGVMIRQNLSPGSREIHLVATRDNGIALQWRDDQDALASWSGTSAPPPPIYYPMWVRIVRNGNEFAAWYSEDGHFWTLPPENIHTLALSDPVLVGLCLTSQLSGALATAIFRDFHIPELEVSTVAITSRDQILREGQTITLDGTRSWNATAFRWEQVVLGDEPRVKIKDFDRALATFVAPALDIGAILTFRLTAYSSVGKDSAVTHVTVRANNAPMATPCNLRGEIGSFSVTLRWDPMPDADCYVVKRAEQPPGEGMSAFQTLIPCVRDTAAIDRFLEEGVKYHYVVAAKNSFPPHEGPPSEGISVTAMPNLALRPDATPFALVTKPIGSGLKNLNAIMNGTTRESYDTYDDYETLDEDWFGLSWPQPLCFDHIVYYTGDHSDEGGWWTSLKVQFSDDGVTWGDAPGVEISPSYNFADSPLGRRPYSRFDIAFRPVRGKFIRIYGTPGGVGGFTSIAELEVYGNQNRSPLTVYGLDRVVDEWQTGILDGRYSFSTRGPIVGYCWQQTGGPPVTIGDAYSPVAFFAAPGVDQDVLFTFTLTASDGIDEATDDVQILLRNVATQAKAGPELSAFENALVQLDGSASVSTSGSLTYEWTQTGGPVVALSDANSVWPSFTAPSVSKFSEKLTFELRVDDGLGSVDSIGSDTVTVLVKNTLNTMPHVEKSGLIVIEAENYTSINRHHDDRGTWQVVHGEPTYVEVPDIPGVGGTREWRDAAEISYDVKIRRSGNYHLKMRRFVPHGKGRDGDKNNSCRVGINGEPIIPEFDNQRKYNRWVWVSGGESDYVTFPSAGTYSLDIRCLEDGYRIDRIILFQPDAPGVPEDWSDEIGPPESAPAAMIACCRELGTHYVRGSSQTVSLHIDVNTPVVPEILILVENFPRDFTVVNSAGGDASTRGRLSM